MLENSFNENTQAEIASGLKSIPYIIFDSVRLVVGFARGAITGQINDRFRRSMIRLFCHTSGYAFDFISFFVSLTRTKKVFKLNGNAVLPKVEESDLNKIDRQLKSDGYHVFDFKLSDKVCDHLTQFALINPGLRRPTDDEVKRGITGSVEELYERGQPKGVRFDFTSRTLLKDQIVQQLICDPTILSVAQNYLGPEPILDIVTMWWSSPSTKADDQAAQHYHYDMDNFRWLKFFFYLTDVTESNGPHIFIKGTHRSGQLPAPFRRQLYVRFSDQLVEKHFAKEQTLLFKGPRGTILAEDTRGVHKGLKVESGDRLLFQLQFSNSKLLTVDNQMRIPRQCHPALLQAIQNYPGVYTKLIMD